MELGLITFDPVLTLDELFENVTMLEDSGLWQYCGQLFNELHVFEGNSYSAILKKLKLDTGFDPDYMTYSYKYLHPEIEQIRDVCTPLKKEVDPVYTSARNVFRTNFTLPDFIEKYVTNYRKRELGVLKELVQHSRPYKEIYDHARDMEYQSVLRLGSDLLHNSFEMKPEFNELITNIDKYIKSLR